MGKLALAFLELPEIRNLPSRESLKLNIDAEAAELALRSKGQLPITEVARFVHKAKVIETAQLLIEHPAAPKPVLPDASNTFMFEEAKERLKNREEMRKNILSFQPSYRFRNFRTASS